MRQEALRSLIIIWLLTIILVSAGCALFQMRPRIITSTGTRYYDPIFTPDGKHIIFTARDSTDATCICGIDGSDVQILAQLPEYGGEVTADGQFVIFSSFRLQQNDIFRLNLITGELLNLTDSPSDDAWLALSPDGGHIAYIKSDEPVYKTTSFPDGHQTRWIKKSGKKSLMVMDIDGLNQTIVAEGGWRPIWHPDGLHLAYKANEITHIWGFDEIDEIIKLNGSLSAWGCGGKTIFYSPPRGGADKPADLHVRDLDGAVDRLVLSNVYARIACHEPTSKMALAVYPFLGDIGYDGIVLIDSSGMVLADYRQPGPGFEYDGISWSPDGQSIAFSRHTRDWICDPALGGIFILSADGKDLRQILSNKMEWHSHK